MDLITGQRTFCIGVSGVGIVNETITQDIAFVDSSGNNINCNYFKLQVGGTNQSSKVLGVVAELSGATGVKLVITNIGANADYNIMLTYGNLFSLNTLRLAESYDAGA